MDSILGDNSIKLEKPYSIRDLAAIARLPDGTKRCRICKEVKNLAEFRMINTKGMTSRTMPANPVLGKSKLVVGNSNKPEIKHTIRSVMMRHLDLRVTSASWDVHYAISCNAIIRKSSRKL